MDLSTKYMGLELKNPIIVGACPLSDSVDNVRRMEDAGASAVVMYSLFEEQIQSEARFIDHFTSEGAESYAEATSYFPDHSEYRRAPATYLEHLHALKEAVDIPIIGSLNGVTRGWWTDYAYMMERAGADAIELNVYLLPTDLEMPGDQIEKLYVDLLESVRSKLRIPVAMKLSPYFSSMANMAAKLDEAGADALVLFNRFYQPDIDLEELEVMPTVKLSTPADLLLPLRWIAILHGKLKASLAGSGGVHGAEQALKLLMAGADAVQVVGTLLKHNDIGRVSTILAGMHQWMEEHEYESVEQMKGSMSHRSVADPGAFERANYMKALTFYHLKDTRGSSILDSY